MDHDPRCTRLGRARADPDAAGPEDAAADTTRRDAPDAPEDHSGGGREPVDWLTAQIELGECDGYVVLAVDPQTGEVDAHGPFPGLTALEAAHSMREQLDREELTDVVVRVVRWHQMGPGQVA